MEVLDELSDDGLPGISSSSSEHSSRSRAMLSCAMGEADRYDVLKGDLAIEALRLFCFLIVLEGVDIVYGCPGIEDWNMNRMISLKDCLLQNAERWKL